MHLSLCFSIFLVLASSLSTYAAPYGTPQAFPDIEQRSPAPLFEPRAEGAQQVLQLRSNPHQEPVPRPGSPEPHPGTSAGRPVHLATRPFARSSTGATSGPDRSKNPPVLFTHWAVVVGDFYYELLLDHAVPNEESSSQGLHGSEIRLNIGRTPMPNGWSALQPKGRTMLSDEDIRAASQDLINNMKTRKYNLITHNCQDFATKLIDCITHPSGQRRQCEIF